MSVETGSWREAQLVVKKNVPGGKGERRLCR